MRLIARMDIGPGAFDLEMPECTVRLSRERDGGWCFDELLLPLWDATLGGSQKIHNEELVAWLDAAARGLSPAENADTSEPLFAGVAEGEAPNQKDES